LENATTPRPSHFLDSEISQEFDINPHFNQDSQIMSWNSGEQHLIDQHLLDIYTVDFNADAGYTDMDGSCNN